ncbi:electron transfer flavoprotein subunit beta/FixA family protein [Paenibacillus sp. FSL K6-3182]|uniref:electron transfer flavoprotein subunit beta/FixA family protein n=1 Tax=Paenibacillus sp. FSL K6-3182 TaxID=2921495 RepID=UPI0030D0A884
MPAIKPSTYARSSRTSIEALTKIAAVLHVYELSALNMPHSGQLQGGLFNSKTAYPSTDGQCQQISGTSEGASMLKIVVLLKQTFDTEEKIIVTPAGVDERDAKFVINPYDEYALEEAIRQREQLGGEVIVITCGAERSQEVLRTALAIGADEAIRLDSADLSDDSSAVAAALAAVIRPLAPDLLLAGLFAVDSGAGSVALQIAELLHLPHAASAVKVTILTAGELGSLPADGLLSSPTAGGAERYALVERDVEGDTETVSIPLPALITAQQGLNEPRYPSLPGIMKAKRKPLRTITAAELIASGELSLESVSPRTARTQLLPPPPRAAGKRLPGDPAEQAAALVSLLREEAKLL